jgi:hypothetical protein
VAEVLQHTAKLPPKLQATNFISNKKVTLQPMNLNSGFTQIKALGL